MADVFDRTKRSAVMARIRSSGNKDTELKFIEILKGRGITGWRRNQKLPGKPDFVFARPRVAVFVDGCFWHGCPRHGRKPGSNQDYWEAKLSRNKARDRRVNGLLRQKGWRVLRFWEHELARAESVCARLRKASRPARAASACGRAAVRVKSHPQ